MSDPFKTFGPPELCTWRYAPGICRFQTTWPKFARKLSQRRGASLVAWSVNKGYLRIFQEAIAPWRARRLVTRYLKAANGAFSKDVTAAKPSKAAGRVVGADVSKEAVLGQITSQNAPASHARVFGSPATPLAKIIRRKGFIYPTSTAGSSSPSQFPISTGRRTPQRSFQDEGKAQKRRHNGSNNSLRHQQSPRSRKPLLRHAGTAQ
jgi:hypothetical protein